MKAAARAAFNAAADTYHSAADVQREVAAALARRLAGLALPPSPRILEVGCGTGFLFQALARDIKDARWLLTDISEAMVGRARQAIGPDHAQFAVMDGEGPALRAATFDLVCTSLAFQWFEDLPAALPRLVDLLKPGGTLAFSTLAAGSFPEWRAAHGALGIAPGVGAYPDTAGLAAMAPAGTRMNIEARRIVRAYPSAHAFLCHWRDIGTHAADPRRTPVGAGTMRKLLRHFARGIDVTYEVVLATLQRP